MEKLLFVYNADDNLSATIKDFVIKLLTPGKYACNLCMVTYGAVSMKREWKKFVAELPREVEFLHRDEFRARYHDDTPLPAAFRLKEGKQHLMISAAEMNRLRTVAELKKLVLEKVGGAEA
jgi:hypothetical protein